MKVEAQCVVVLFMLALAIPDTVVSSATAVSDTNITSNWRICTLDANGNAGSYASLAINERGSPNPFIVYRESDNMTLRLAYWSPGGWIVEDLNDSEGRKAELSVYWNRTGWPATSYVDATNGDIIYAKKVGEGWEFTVVRDGVAGSSIWGSVALNADGLPSFAIYDRGSVYYVWWNGTAWQETGISDGFITSRGLDIDTQGHPHIAYKRMGIIYYTYWDGSSWINETVENETLPSTPILSLDDSDNPYVSYKAYNEEEVRLAYKQGDAWEYDVVSSGNLMGLNSIALDSEGNPHIAFFELGDWTGNTTLNYARRVNGTWDYEMVEIVDSEGLAAAHSVSLGLDSSNLPHIAYWQRGTDDLRYATKAELEGGSLPVASAGQDQVIGEGEAARFNGSGSYDPEGANLSFEWDFDASADSNGDGNFTNDAEATGPTPTHVYYDDGVYVVTLTVTDESGLSDSDTCNITVLNVAPIPEWTSQSSDGTILNPPYPEGKEILFTATVSDPGIYDTFTYDWDMGDGTVYLDAGPSITHTYGDDDIYIVVLTVTDDDGGVGIDDTPPLETTNEDPVASINIPYCIFTEGTNPCAPIGEFTDPGWLDTHAAVWNLGDGTYETAVLTEENDPPDATGWNITSHVYGDDGTYTITFTVTDDDGGVGSASAEAQVINLPPTLEIIAPSPVNEGEDLILDITATDPGSDDIILTVDWGDGASETMTYYNNGVGPDPPNSGEGVWPFTVTASLTHVYGDNGNFTVQVTAADDDGDSVQDSTVAEVLNLPPEIMLLAVPLSVNEGEEFSVVAEATDPGSDDIEFSWTFELGPSMSAMYYNDGVAPDPLPSPWGIFPFTAEDRAIHTYGDNGIYNVAIVATDDDGGVSTMTFAIDVINVAPSVDIGEPYWGDENSAIEFTATAVDPGSDDLTLIWDWGDGTTEAIAFYNDGANDDPSKSPWGMHPFEATHTTSHLWGDNGDFLVTLTVQDDDGGVTVEQTVVTVNNVAPTIGGISYYLSASLAFRIAGEKWHNAEIHLYEDGTEVGYASITRYPGSPNEQMVDLGEFSIDFSKTYSAVAYYTPEDDPVNGQIWGSTPAWVILEYEDGEERIHHTFNVRHEDTWTWVIDDFSPYFLGHNITFVATASDPGSDDLTFEWDFGDGGITENVYYNDGIGPDPYPSPEVNPITVTDTVRHGYSSAGTYTITLTVTDDDGGITSYSLNLTL